MWRYLSLAYTNDVLRSTWPADEEIVLHWLPRTALTPASRADRERALHVAGRDNYSLDVPAGVKIPV